jgi:hypothetical protein
MNVNIKSCITPYHITSFQKRNTGDSDRSRRRSPQRVDYQPNNLFSNLGEYEREKVKITEQRHTDFKEFLDDVSIGTETIIKIDLMLQSGIWERCFSCDTLLEFILS